MDNCLFHSLDTLTVFRFGDDNRIRSCRKHDGKIFQSAGAQGVDSHHDLGLPEVQGFDRIGHQEPRRILFFRDHRVFKVKNHRIGSQQRTFLDHPGPVAGQIDA